MSEHVTLIIPVTPSQALARAFADKGGGEQHRLQDMLAGSAQKPINLDILRENFDRALKQIGTIISNLKNNTVLGWKAESVSFSLAVSAEGSIGIATVGAEGTIEVTFKPQKDQSPTPA